MNEEVYIQIGTRKNGRFIKSEQFPLQDLFKRTKLNIDTKNLSLDIRDLSFLERLRKSTTRNAMHEATTKGVLIGVMTTVDKIQKGLKEIVENDQPGVNKK